MMKIRFLAAAVFALASATALASSEDAETAYDAGRYAEALALLEERGLEGDVEAQGMAGMMHLMGGRLYGDQVASDPERAARWLRAAALNGSVQAQFMLAQLYRLGLGVPHNPEHAAALFAQLEVPYADTKIAQAPASKQ
jgi:TPR repeat protein